MQWCTKNNFLIASYILVFQKPIQMCTQIAILDCSQLTLLMLSMSSFQSLNLNVFCYFHPTQNFRRNTFLEALAGSGSCVISCTPPQTIRWKLQKYSASLIKLELLGLSMRQQQAVQSFVPRSVCLFFEAASFTHIEILHLSQLLLLMLSLYQVFKA